MHESGFLGVGMARFRADFWASTAGTFAAAAALASCGNAPVSAPVAQGATVDMLVARIDGTMRENNAAQLLARRAQQTAVQRCMASQGQRYGLDILDSPVWTDDIFRVGYGSAWLEPLYRDFNIGDALLRRPVSDKQPKTFDGWTVSQRNSYDAALDRCENAGDSDFVVFPPAHDPLLASLSRVLAPYDKQAGERAGEYATCMSGRGFDVEQPIELYELLSAQYPRGETPTSVADASSAWQRAYQQERAAAEADIACRAPIYEATMAEAADAVNTWAQKNGAELAAIDQQWARMCSKPSSSQKRPGC